MFTKDDVNGPKTRPTYKYLKEKVSICCYWFESCYVIVVVVVVIVVIVVIVVVVVLTPHNK